MSKASSKTSKNEPEPPAPVNVWRMLPYLLGGIVCVLAASAIASYTDLGRNLAVDLKGQRAPGEAEPLQDGAYRLRFVAPSGDIHRRKHTGGMGIQRVPEGGGGIMVVYNPDQPGQFQPFGLSVTPGILAVGLFLAGMVLIIHARRSAMSARRRK